MKFYKKNDMVYIRFNETPNGVDEVFNSPQQQRIVKSVVPQLFENMVNRVVVDNFEEITEEEFTNIYNQVKSML